MGAMMSYVISMLGLGGQPALSTVPDPGTGLSEKDRDLIRKTWALVATPVKTRSATGVEFFIQLFRAHPYMLKYFRDFEGKSDAELRSMAQLKKHGMVVMCAIDSYVWACDDAEGLVGLVQKLAESHNTRDIKKKQFQDLREMFIPFLVNSLGPSVATKEVAEAWDKLMGALVMVVDQTQAELDKQDKQG